MSASSVLGAMVIEMRETLTRFSTVNMGMACRVTRRATGFLPSPAKAARPLELSQRRIATREEMEIEARDNDRTTRTSDGGVGGHQ